MKEFVNPFSENFLSTWELWKEFRKEAHKFEYLSIMSEQAAINYLVDISEGDEQTATKIVNQSIRNRWKEFYELRTKKIKGNGTKQTTNPAAARQSLNDLYNQRFGEGG